MKETYKVGQIIEFSMSGDVIAGEIVQVRKRFWRKIEYRVIYGIGCIGYKVASADRWVDENDILKLANPEW